MLIITEQLPSPLQCQSCLKMYYLCMLNTLTHMMCISLGSPLVVLLARVLMF